MQYKTVRLGVDSGQMCVRFYEGEYKGKPDVSEGLVVKMPFAPGKYVIMTELMERENRVAELHVAKVAEGRGALTGADHVIEVTVAGVVVVGDPCYFLEGEFDNDESDGSEYDEACRASLDHDGGYRFADGKGFCSGTGYGDGEYDCELKVEDDGTFGGASVYFVEEEEDIDSEDEWDDDPWDNADDDSDEDEDEEDDDDVA